MITKKKSNISFASMLSAIGDLSKYAENQLDKEINIQHVFIDNVAISKDTEYELFYIRKNDGSRFYSPRQLRMLQQANTFTSYFNKDGNVAEIKDWKDRLVQVGAAGMLKHTMGKINRFFHESSKSKNVEIVKLVNSMLHALMLTSYRENKTVYNPQKCCLDYFHDFLHYLYASLQSREYQHYNTYPIGESNNLTYAILDLLHTICRNLVLYFASFQELVLPIEEWIAKNLQSTEKGALSKLLESEYLGLESSMKSMQNKFLKRQLQSLKEGEFNYYSPYKQGNLPVQLYSVYFQDKKCTNIKLPAPIHQSYIDDALIDEVFQGYLKALQKDPAPRKHLIINMQDRTSWRESARSRVLEMLEEMPIVKEHLNIVTLAWDTDFYHQTFSYVKDNEYEVFISHFKEHLIDLSAGYYFSEEIKKALFPEFIDTLSKSIHRLFFASKELLSIEERQVYIDIFYLFLVVKLIEITDSDLFSFTCKDGVDSSNSVNIMLFCMMKLINNQEITKNELELIHYLLYASPLLYRERLMLKDRAYRTFNVLKKMEELRNTFEGKNFSLLINEAILPLYDTKFLQGQIVISHL